MDTPFKKDTQEKNGLHPLENGLRGLENGLHPFENGHRGLENGLHPLENGHHGLENGLHPRNGHPTPEKITLPH